MKKGIILFLLCSSIFASGGGLYAGTVSIAGKRANSQTNAPRITIGSYIKSRGLTSVKSGSGDSKPVPSNTSTDSDIEELNTSVSGIETRVDNIENQTDDMNSQISSITNTITNTIYKKDDIDDLLLGKQNTLPSGAVTGQVLTQGETGLEWETPNTSLDVYTKGEIDDRFDVVDQSKQDNLPIGAESGQVLSYGSDGLEWKTLSSPPGTLPLVSEPGLYIISVWSGGEYYMQKVELTEDYYTN